MQYGIMITNGGPHPPEKWAVTSAEQIFPISNDIDGTRAIQAKKVQLAIVEALLPHHEGTMTREQGKLAHTEERFNEPHDPENVVDDALDAVIACLKGTPWQDKGEDPAWRQVVGNILCSHFATVMDIERSYHAHRNKTEAGKAFLVSKHGA